MLCEWVRVGLLHLLIFPFFLTLIITIFHVLIIGLETFDLAVFLHASPERVSQTKVWQLLSRIDSSAHLAYGFLHRCQDSILLEKQNCIYLVLLFVFERVVFIRLEHGLM